MKTAIRFALPMLAVGATLLAVAASASASVIVSPLPGTVSAMPQTQISFLGARASQIGHISVVGSVSGHHSGRLRSYVSAAGESFIPRKGFVPGERVVVHATLRGARGHAGRLTTFFTIGQPAAIPQTEFPAVPGTPADVQNFHSAPELHPPSVYTHQAAGSESAPGYVFGAPFLGPAQWGPMIFDSAGNLVWFQQVPPGQDAADFRTQVLHGKLDLTWWQGKTIQFGYGLGEDVIEDANYRTVAVVHAGNGLQTDEHEFNVTPQGTAYVLAYSPIQTSLASVGASPTGIALDGVVQEVDIATHLVMWEWHSLGHVDLSESYSKPPTGANGVYDYFHINSVVADAHGNLLVSARNTWTLYDINHHTGAITWRVGGKKSTFNLGPGVQFSYQHNAQWLPNGDISLFDDEGAPPVKPPSRGEVIHLDTAHRTATLAAQLVRGIGPLLTSSQGNSQSLPGGGWMLGWGGLPNFTEFNAAGKVIYDAQFPRGEFSYRVYRLPWSGQPLTPPSIAALAGGARATVYASWNGATTVASWQLLTGASPDKLVPVSTTPRSGFETAMPSAAAPFYEVRALSASGRVLGTSKAVAATAG